MTAANPGAESAIELRIDKIAQLFNSLDPTPFRRRDLDLDAEQHIVAWAQDIDRSRALGLVVHLPPSEAESALAAEVGPAIRNYFAYLDEKETARLRSLARDGRNALAIGLVILAVSLVSTYLVATYVPFSNLSRLIEESLVILGWVGIWGPLEILLYDRVSPLRRRRLYRRLAKVAVEIRSTGAEPRAA
jgi:hypothetical protein